MNKFRALLSYLSSIGIFNTLDYIFQRYVAKKNIISIKAKGIKDKIFLRRNSTDVNVFQQLFIKKDLSFLKGRDLEVVIDAGANIGLATIYIKQKFPKAYVYAIEPEFANFGMLEINTKCYNNVTTIHKALSEDSEGLYLVDIGKGFDAFQTEKYNNNKFMSHKIESISIDDIVRQHNISKLDLVKIDIEGAEKYCLDNSAMSWVNITQLIAVEIHEHLAPGVAKQIKNLLKDFKFSQHGEYSVFENINLK